MPCFTKFFFIALFSEMKQNTKAVKALVLRNFDPQLISKNAMSLH